MAISFLFGVLVWSFLIAAACVGVITVSVGFSHRFFLVFDIQKGLVLTRYKYFPKDTFPASIFTVMSWDKITVGQFQQIYELSNSNADDFDKTVKAICILHNKTEAEVDDMTQAEFAKIAKETAFVFTNKIPGKARRYIRVNGRKYGVQYDPRKIRFRQYAEVCFNASTLIPNLHRVMASIVQPVKMGVLWRRNKAEDHDRISDDLLNARFVDVYHAAVFFCTLYRNSITSIRDYLVEEMMAKGKTREEAEMLLDLSIHATDGFSQPNNSPGS